MRRSFTVSTARPSFFEGYYSEEAWLVRFGEYDRCVELDSFEPYDGLADVYWADSPVCGL